MDEDVTRRLTAWSGIAAATLFAIGNAVWALGMPSGGTPTDEIVSFYESRAVRIVVGASVSLLSLAVFVLFASALRSVIAWTSDDEVLATTAFAGLVLTVAAGVGAESVNMIGGLRAAEGQVDAALARSAHEISQMFGSVASGVGVGVFALAVAVAALRTGRLMPRYGAVISAVAGVAALTPVSYFNVVPATLLILVTLTVSIALLRGPWPRASQRDIAAGGGLDARS